MKDGGDSIARSVARRRHRCGSGLSSPLAGRRTATIWPAAIQRRAHLRRSRRSFRSPCRRRPPSRSAHGNRTWCASTWKSPTAPASRSKDCSADQFTITDDGKAQKISIFSYSDIEEVETAGPENTKPLVVPVDSDAPKRNGSRQRPSPRPPHDRALLRSDLDGNRRHAPRARRRREIPEAADDEGRPRLRRRFQHAASRVLANFTNDRAMLDKAIAQLLPGAASQLATIRCTPPRKTANTTCSRIRGAAYTPDETEFNVFNTDQKLDRRRRPRQRARPAIPGRKARHRIHRRHHADGRRKSHRIARRHRRRQPRRRLDLFDRCARPVCHAAGRRRHHRRRHRHFDVHAARPCSTRPTSAKIRATRSPRFPPTPAARPSSISAI